MCGLEFGWLEMVHPDDRTNAAEAFRQAVATREHFRFEHRLRYQGTTWRWALGVGSPRFGPNDNFLGYVGSLIDIHDRKIAEENLRQSQDRHGLLLASMGQGWGVLEVVHDVDGSNPVDYRILEANEAFAKITKLENVPGRTVRELAPNLDPGLSTLLSKVAAITTAKRFIHQDETIGRHLQVTACRLPSKGAVVIVLLIDDVTHDVERERELQETKERYQAFVANSSEGIWRIEFEEPIDTTAPAEVQIDAIYLHSRFAECNLAFARMYGFSELSDVIGRTLELTLPRSPESEAFLRTIIANAYRVTDVESREQRNDGSSVWFSNSMSGVVDKQRLVRVWGTQRDISDRVQVQIALEQSDEHKNNFLATLGHELRNLIAPARYATEIMRRPDVPAATADRQKTIIERQVHHIGRLIDDLLDISRIARDRIDMKMERVQLQDVVRSAGENAACVFAEKNQQLDTRYPPEPLYVRGDEVRLVQVLTNLLTNAAKYSPRGSGVHLSLQVDHTVATIIVRDEGEGLHATHLERVFDLFYQGTNSAAQGGLGIGLALVRRIVELHGGSVRARSEGPGKGSEFVVCLPLSGA